LYNYLTSGKLFSKTEKRLTEFFEMIGGLSSFSVRFFKEVFIPPYEIEQIRKHMIELGMKTLPIVGVTGFIIGLVIAMQLSPVLIRFGAEAFLPGSVGISIVRELGPVICALIFAGRVSSGIGAELGSMRVTEQIDALETLSTNPVKYLVVPRFLALSLTLPLLTLYADILGIFGGYLVCVYKLGISSSMYLNITFDALLYKDVFTGLGKTVFFGMIIAWVSCYEGFNVEGGAEGVGRATTRSVVTTFILIITADCFFTALFYFVVP